MADIRQVAVIGTGIMGAPMAARLAEAGFSVKAWNRSADKAAVLAEKGVQPTVTAAEAAAEADVVLCMLSSGPVCNDVLLGSPGIVSAMKPGAVLLVMSSIPVEIAMEQAEAAMACGVRYVDAPVSGGEKGAIEGTLAIMAGGEQRDVDALRPLLGFLGRVTHVGPVGCGSLAKLANQLIVASTICAVAEALTLAEEGERTRHRCATPCLADLPIPPSSVSTENAWLRAISAPAGRRNIRSRIRPRHWPSPEAAA